MKSAYEWRWQSPRDADMQSMQQGLRQMAIDIHNQAVRNAPVLTGALRRSGRFYATGALSVTVRFGGGKVDYAELREHENRRHPGTRFYLKRAGEAVSAKAETYFRF